MRHSVCVVLFGALCGAAIPAASQQASVSSKSPATSELSTRTSSWSGDDTLPDAPDPQQPIGTKEKNPYTTPPAANKSVPPPRQQPKRILGLMPNYRAVSAGAIPPPPTAAQSFKIATQNSFDYSAFVFVGLTSLLAEGEESHPKLGKGVPGFWAYSWRGFVDKTDGNYWVIWALPSVFHEDERYFAKGEGSILKRAEYSTTRIFVTPDYHGKQTINGAELLGRGIAQGISLSYYPSSDRTAGALAQKYAYALLRDAATNTFREFWPDIASHLQRHRQSDKNTE